MSILNYFIWTADPEIFDFLPVRWYGLLFAMGFIIGQQIMFYIYKQENKPEKDVDALTLYMIIATVIGARLGHVLFYEPAEYLSNPVNILKIWEGGLASHGAAFGIIIGLYLYSNYQINLNPFKFQWKKQKRKGQDFLWVLDRIVILAALGGCFIRLGNFMNSEIIGKPTESSYGVVFARDAIDVFERMQNVDNVAVINRHGDENGENGLAPLNIRIEFNRGTDAKSIEFMVKSQVQQTLASGRYLQQHFKQPGEFDYEIVTENTNKPYVNIAYLGIIRHPAQLYESATSLLLFIFLMALWLKMKGNSPRGIYFGLFLIILFGLRFVHELFKENQVDFESEIPLNMGQWLSIPLILIGIYILANLKKWQKYADKE